MLIKKRLLAYDDIIMILQLKRLGIHLSAHSRSFLATLKDELVVLRMRSELHHRLRKRLAVDTIGQLERVALHDGRKDHEKLHSRK